MLVPLAIGLFVFLRHLFDNDPRIIIDEEGVTDNTLWVGKILWADIRGASLRSIRGQSFISLELDDEGKYLKNLSSSAQTLTVGNTWLGFKRLNINLSGVASDENKILQIILERSAKHRPARVVPKPMAYEGFKPGDSVVWYKLPSPPEGKWPIEAKVLKTTAKRVEIEFTENGQRGTRYVKPENLRVTHRHEQETST